MSETTYQCTAAPEDTVTIYFESDHVVTISTHIAPGRAVPVVCISRDDLTDLHRRIGEHLGLPAPAPAPFLENARFEDVRKGDVVRTEWTEGGVKLVRESVVEEPANRYSDWANPAGWWIGMDSAARCGGTITILNRPTPQLPTLAGSVVKVLFGNGATSGSMTLGIDGLWRGKLCIGDGGEDDYTPERLAALTTATPRHGFEVIA